MYHDRQRRPRAAARKWTPTVIICRFHFLYCVQSLFNIFWQTVYDRSSRSSSQWLHRQAAALQQHLRYFENPNLTPVLRALIQESSLPLKAVDVDFAADSSGFTPAGLFVGMTTDMGRSGENIHGSKSI